MGSASLTPAKVLDHQSSVLLGSPSSSFTLAFALVLRPLPVSGSLEEQQEKPQRGGVGSVA
jgi:hypothetical protein